MPDFSQKNSYLTDIPLDGELIHHLAHEGTVLLARISRLIKKHYYMNNLLDLHAPWDEVKAKLKEKNIQLTDDDLHYESGNEDALLVRLETKLNRSKQEVKEYIESISTNRGGAD